MNNQELATRTRDTAEAIGLMPSGGHLLIIREGLKEDHEAVMIGAGFSLNARG